MTALKRLRDDQSKTREQVAAALGVSLGTIRNWEVGSAEPSATKADDLAAYYNIPVSEVIKAIRETWRQNADQPV